MCPSPRPLRGPLAPQSAGGTRASSAEGSKPCPLLLPAPLAFQKRKRPTAEAPPSAEAAQGLPPPQAGGAAPPEASAEEVIAADQLRAPLDQGTPGKLDTSKARSPGIGEGRIGKLLEEKEENEEPGARTGGFGRCVRSRALGYGGSPGWFIATLRINFVIGDGVLLVRVTSLHDLLLAAAAGMLAVGPGKDALGPLRTPPPPRMADLGPAHDGVTDPISHCDEAVAKPPAEVASPVVDKMDCYRREVESIAHEHCAHVFERDPAARPRREECCGCFVCWLCLAIDPGAAFATPVFACADCHRLAWCRILRSSSRRSAPAAAEAPPAMATLWPRREAAFAALARGGAVAGWDQVSVQHTFLAVHRSVTSGAPPPPPSRAASAPPPPSRVNREERSLLVLTFRPTPATLPDRARASAPSAGPPPRPAAAAAGPRLLAECLEEGAPGPGGGGELTPSTLAPDGGSEAAPFEGPGSVRSAASSSAPLQWPRTPGTLTSGGAGPAGPAPLLDLPSEGSAGHAQDGQLQALPVRPPRNQGLRERRGVLLLPLRAPAEAENQGLAQARGVCRRQ
ncbi:unnamed protein product, partial [Prorocentrum cordatum]